MKLLTCVGRNYQVNHKIGSGSFGEIYVGKDLQTGEEVAIKAESIHRKNPHLVFECNVYRSMNLSVGIPKIYWFGVDGDFAVLVMQLLGPSLEDLFFQSGRRFSLKTTLLLADQMIERLERVHSKYFIHRDIKPHNFLMGRPGTDTEQTLYLIDFGLAKNFRNVKTRCHIPYRDGKSLTGTARYVSIKTHLGVEQSRRDDLESLGYVFIYFLKGILPWQGLKATSKKDKYEKITERKLTTSIETLCKHQPQEFVLYIQYCRNLGFTDPPNYKYLRKLLKDVARKLNYQYDNIYDWTKVPKNICPALKNVQNKLIYQRTNDSQVAKGDQKEDTNHQHQQFQQPSVHQLQISSADQNINQVITSINATSNCINYNYRLPQLGELAATPAVAAVSPKTTDVESIKCE